MRGTSNQIFKKRGGGGCLTGPQLLEGGCWERGGELFQRGWNFQTKKIKCEIFNDKKKFIGKKIFFSVCHN